MRAGGYVMRVSCARSRTRWASCTRWTTRPSGAAGWSACWPSWRSGARPSPPAPPSASSRSTCTACTCSCATAAASSRSDTHHNTKTNPFYFNYSFSGTFETLTECCVIPKWNTTTSPVSLYCSYTCIVLIALTLQLAAIIILYLLQVVINKSNPNCYSNPIRTLS